MAQDLSSLMEEEAGRERPVSARVQELAEEVIVLDETIEQLEEGLKLAKSRRHEVRSRLLPDAMNVYGSNDATLASGHKITLKHFVEGNIPKEGMERERALAELEKIGGGDLLRTTVTVEFEKKELERAKLLVQLIKEIKLHEGQNSELEAVMKSTVHVQTLHAFLRQLCKDGKPFDQDALGVFAGMAAKVEKPKEK